MRPLILLAGLMLAGRVAAEADSAPGKLESAARPFISQLVTRWGAEQKSEKAWSEYPRPHLVRTEWTNLNGPWDHAVIPKGHNAPPAKWDGKLVVPFPLESKLGGVQRLLKADERLWYRRGLPGKPAGGKRALLHFEAVDHRCEVFVNGQSVGTHVGGHTPFHFDITDRLREGVNELVVRVEDETEGWQLRGKQVLAPRGIWYTQVSGIWQAVWLETVPERHVADLKITTEASRGTITVRPLIVGKEKGGSVRVAVLDGNRTVATQTGPLAGVTLKVPGARLWSPESPFLYDLEISFLDQDGKALETVKSYAGIRTLGKVRDAAGHLRFTLNGKEVFHFGPLDQGWWPDGLLTPPSDTAMKSDIEFLKAAGFNMIRKHIKVEPRRYYHHCDKIGMMVWQDQVSAGHNPPWTRLAPNPKDADWPDEHHAQWMVEFERMIDTLENHPSIVMWVPFNEAWGQHRTVEVGKWAMKRDPTRPINIASGGNFWKVGDVVDEHHYPHPVYPFNEKRDDGFVKVMGEFGGHGWPVTGHLWDPNRRNWGYGNIPKTLEELRERYAASIRMLTDLKARGIAAGVYTQTTDVEGEINGLLTYDRKVAKIPAVDLAKLHKPLYAPAGAEEPRPARPGANGPARPNVLFIAVDDLNHWVGHLGRNKQAKTPNIDRLARMGVTFTRAYCAAPVCNPSRTALMSGMRPGTTGVYDNGQDWKPVIGIEKTLNTRFLNAGYEVFGCGKIYHAKARRPGEWTDYLTDEKERAIPHPESRDDGVGGIKFRPLTNDSKLVDEGIVDYGIRQLGAKHDKPFFLAVGLIKPHMPWNVPKRFYDMFPIDGIELPPTQAGDLADVPAGGLKMAKPEGDHAAMLKSGRWKEAVRAYLATIAFCDEQVGRLLDAYDKSPHKGNTIIVFWGDHGWHLGEKEHWRKFALWEEATRMPYLWVAPGVTRPGGVCERPVDLMSVYPTLCSLCGIDMPGHVEGENIRPLLADPRARWDKPAITTYWRNNHAVRTERWRYIRYADGGEELYDHEKDGHEWVNLAKEEKFAAVKAELGKLMPARNAPSLPTRVK